MSTYIQRIFFVTSGTNCEDILRALGGNSNKNECNITELGVKQLYMAQSNEKIKAILNPLNTSYYLTSSDRASIQSGLAFYTSITGKNSIYPIPYVGKNKEKYNDLKKSFNPEFYNKKYWNSIGLKKNASYSNIIGNMPKIDWTYMENKTSSNLISFLLKLAGEEIKRTGTTKNIILVCDAKTISETLRKIISSTKYKIERNAIYEYSSIWNIDLKITKNTGGNMKFQVNDNIQKVYPTPTLQLPLKYNPNTSQYIFPYNGFEFILFDALKKIPLKYIKYITYILCGKKKDIIANKIKKIDVNNLKEENLIPEIKIKNKKADMFEHLIKNYV